MKYISLFFISFFYCFATAEEPVFPYQNCNTENQLFTQGLVSALSPTEARFCSQCEENSLSTNDLLQQFKTMISSHSTIPKECFLAMAIRGNDAFKDNQYKYCESKDSMKVSSYRKVCVNEDYVDLIHKAFTSMSSCFDFDMNRQKEILSLINQESGGILNVNSNSDARCLGQITKGYVTTINDLIINHSKTYNKVHARCPEVQSLILDSEKINTDTGIDYLTCQATRDPYVCLFYTFFDFERNHRQINSNLNSPLDYMGNRGEFSNQEKIQFHLPIQLNEILTVTVELNNEKKTWTVWDDSELYDILRKPRDSKLKILTVQKIPLFKEERHIETMFNYLSHNGGGAYSENRMVAMVERLKQAISKSCSNEQQKTKRCIFRKQIQKGESLSASQILPVFEKDVLDNHPSSDKKRIQQVAYYTRKVIKTNQAVFEYEEGSKNTNMMLNGYKKAMKFKDIELSDKDARNFQKHIAKTCPRADFISL